MSSMLRSYIEIVLIQNIMADNQITLSKISGPDINSNFHSMGLSIVKEKYVVKILDEYEDLKYNNPILDFVLVIRELELLNDSKDYLDWSKVQGIEPNNDELRDYYITITKALPVISEYFPNKEITSFINDLDFQLNAGAMQLLRKPFKLLLPPK